jgi:hypothetical protein
MTVMSQKPIAGELPSQILRPIQAFTKHELPLDQAKSEIVRLFDGHPNENLRRRLKTYVDRMLARVSCDEITLETAAGDIQAMIAAVLAGDPDAPCLAELGPE